MMVVDDIRLFYLSLFKLGYLIGIISHGEGSSSPMITCRYDDRL